MKKFFLDIKKSFSSKEFYMEARHKELSSGLGFFFRFILFLSVLSAVLFLIFYLIFVAKYVEPFRQYIDKSFPIDLVVEIKDKQLSTNKGIDPISFAFPDFIYSKVEDKTKIKPNLIVLAPAENGTDIKLVEQYNTYTLFTQDRFFSQKTDGTVSVEKMNFEDKKIGKEEVNNFVDKFFGFYMILSLLLSVPIMFVFYTFVSLNLFLALVLVTFVFYLFMKGRDPLLKHKDVLKMGIYTLVPVFIINIIFLFVDISSFLLSSLVIFVILFYVFAEKEKIEESVDVINIQEISKEEARDENKEEVKQDNQ